MSGGLYNLHKKSIDTTLDTKALKPYGDTVNDGKVQLSFTLPVKNDERGQEAAKLLGISRNEVYRSTIDDKN